MSQLIEQAVMVAGKGFGNRVVAIKRRWSVGGSTVYTLWRRGYICAVTCSLSNDYWLVNSYTCPCINY